LPISKLATNYEKVEELSSSRNPYPSTARSVATSVILTVTSSKSDRAPTSRTVKHSAQDLAESELRAVFP
jgi:hypothetical protein